MKVGKKRAKKSKMYFGSSTHNAIVEYQKCESAEKRKEIYEKRILKSFNKLVENLIFIHGFSSDTLPYVLY